MFMPKTGQLGLLVTAASGETEPAECISLKNNQLEINCQQYTVALNTLTLCAKHSIISLPLPGDLKVEQAHNLQLSQIAPGWVLILLLCENWMKTNLRHFQNKSGIYSV